MSTGKTYCFAAGGTLDMAGAYLKNSAFVPLIKNHGQPMERECRICLSHEDQNSKLFKFCKCSGTIEYIHQKCLKQWIMIKISQKTDVVRCELCQEQFNYTKKSRKVLSCEQILQIIKEKPLSSFLKLFIYLCLLIGNVFFTSLLIIATSEPDGNNLKEKLLFSQKMAAIYTVIIIIIYLTLIFLAIVFIGNFCIKEQVQIQIRIPEQDRNMSEGYLFPVRLRHKKITIAPSQVHRVQ